MPTPKRRRRDSEEEEPIAKRQRGSRSEKTLRGAELTAPSTRITRSRLLRLSGGNPQARDRVAVWVDTGSIGDMPSSNSSSRRRSKQGASKRSHSVRSTTSHNTTATSFDSECSVRTIHDPRVSGILLENNIYEPGQGKEPDNRPDNYDAIME